MKAGDKVTIGLFGQDIDATVVKVDATATLERYVLELKVEIDTSGWVCSQGSNG